jgi:hypothetical protein
MLKKWLIVFAFAGLAVASAKTYSFTLFSPTAVGKTQLKPGDYKLKLDGSKAILTNNMTRKMVETDVKVEQNRRKFEQTAVDTVHANGIDHLKAIELQGTKMKLAFN